MTAPECEEMYLLFFCFLFNFFLNFYIIFKFSLLFQNKHHYNMTIFWFVCLFVCLFLFCFVSNGMQWLWGCQTWVANSAIWYINDPFLKIKNGKYTLSSRYWIVSGIEQYWNIHITPVAPKSGIFVRTKIVLLCQHVVHMSGLHVLLIYRHGNLI